MSVGKIPTFLDLLVDYLMHVLKKRSARCIIIKLVFTASCYFIWQERNNRLYKKMKRPKDQVIEVIESNVCLKLLSCRFKKTGSVEVFLHRWKLPNSLIRSN